MEQSWFQLVFSMKCEMDGQTRLKSMYVFIDKIELHLVWESDEMMQDITKHGNSEEVNDINPVVALKDQHFIINFCLIDWKT